MGTWDAVRMLIEKGANLESKDQNGRTALILGAVRSQNLEAVKLLLEKGANIEAKDNNGWSPLWHATSQGATEIRDFLREKGANSEFKDLDGQVPSR